MYELSEDLAHFDLKALWCHVIRYYVHLRLHFVARLKIFRSFSFTITYSKFNQNNSALLKNIGLVVSFLTTNSMQSVVLYQNKCPDNQIFLW